MMTGSAHTPEQQRVIAEYQAAVDSGLVQFADGVSKGTIKSGDSYRISSVSQRGASDIKSLTGVDVEGATHNIQADNIRHIALRHGANGEADRSMANLEDVARARYVLENYDSIELSQERNNKYINRDGNFSPTVLYRKAVDGTYVIVEAVPDGRKKKLHVVSMWIETNKNKADNPVLTNAGDNPPQPNVQNGYKAPTDITGTDFFVRPDAGNIPPSGASETETTQCLFPLRQA